MGMWKIGGLIVIVLVLVSLVLAWAFRPPETSPARFTVAASILPIADIVKNIAGDDVEVTQIVPSGASPHSYNLTPQDLAAVQRSRVVFLIGHNLDDWSARPAAQNADVSVVTLDANIPLRDFGVSEDDQHEDEHEAGSVDPHYWLAVPNAKTIASTVAQTLSTIDPAYATTYQDNFETYIGKLDGLEEELQAMATIAPQKHFFAMHDAWSYFAEQYGFELVATYEPIEGREPSITDLNRIRQVVTLYGIKNFYAEPQKQSSSATRFLAKEFGLEIRILDPEGSMLPGYNSYINMMRSNMRQLVD